MRMAIALHLLIVVNAFFVGLNTGIGLCVRTQHGARAARVSFVMVGLGAFFMLLLLFMPWYLGKPL